MKMIEKPVLDQDRKYAWEARICLDFLWLKRNCDLGKLPFQQVIFYLKVKRSTRMNMFTKDR